ncbi:histone H3-like centromeric protein A [Ceratitis capitata]|uniref:(Mediterranean fruit fly) hypothetical protein n=1 Tax=Ceratitis capitata TaxID=7213 RepID=A0A811VAB3_CERCA|nr:histone H3-like centromeric protein A [Ceratitis capitata]CAD7012270.1 unnamed protein product [Ceratitis capitata]
MRPPRKPGPKSRRQKGSSLLGDTDTDSTPERLSSFRTPPRDVNLTDYNLDISGSSGTRTRFGGTAKVTSIPGRSTRISAAKTTALVPTEAPTTSICSMITTIRKETTIKRKTRKQKQPKKAEFRKLLNRTDFMIPRAAFARLVREIMVRETTDVTHLTQLALEALQTSCEKFIENRFEDAYLLTLHARRITLLVRDLELVNFLLDK